MNCKGFEASSGQWSTPLYEADYAKSIQDAARKRLLRCHVSQGLCTLSRVNVISEPAVL